MLLSQVSSWALVLGIMYSWNCTQTRKEIQYTNYKNHLVCPHEHLTASYSRLLLPNLCLFSFFRLLISFLVRASAFVGDFEDTYPFANDSLSLVTQRASNCSGQTWVSTLLILTNIEDLPWLSRCALLVFPGRMNSLPLFGRGPISVATVWEYTHWYIHIFYSPLSTPTLSFTTFLTSFFFNLQQKVPPCESGLRFLSVKWEYFLLVGS